MNRLRIQFVPKPIPAIFFAILMILSVIPAFAIPAYAQSDQPLPEHAAIGYYLAGNGGSNKTLREVDPRWNVINVSFIETRGNHYTPYLALDLPTVYPGTEEQQKQAFIKDIQFVQTRGQKVVISCGGQNGVVHFDNTDQRDIFLNGTKQIIRDYGFDGFDVDFEGSSIACMNSDRIGNLVTQQSINLLYILRNLKETFGEGFIISMAPEYCYVQGGAISIGSFGAFLPVMDACRDILTYIHPQYYNGYNGDFTWLQPSANAGSSFSQVYSAEGYIRLSEMLITGFVTMDKGTFQGLSPSQVAFGVPARNGAGNGAQSPSVYAQALTALLEKYPTYRGIMTWSIGWDETGSNSFIHTIGPIIAEANGSQQPEQNAQTPTITGQPSDQTVGIKESAPLTVTAYVSKGTLSYQWYTVSANTNTGGTAVSGATEKTYLAPSHAEGTSYYYCEVTNTDNTAVNNKTAKAKSNAACVVVNNGVQTDAAAPVITSQPSDATVVQNGVVTLSVAANVTTGTLSYQWYTAPGKNNTGGTPVSGAADASFNPPTDTIGTGYYYCVVTNTDQTASNNQTALASTNAVSVTVTEPLSTGDTWQADVVYTAGQTVVYQGQTYLCKWWTLGDVPSAGGPWKLQGTPISNEYVPGAIYIGGDIVSYQGQTWQANWWTTAVPGSDASWSLV